jgi:1-phosphofructokinase/tagatose 6-phosphate kinase
MILTVTANAAVDKTLTVANLQLGRRHRAQQGLVMPGGKGLNVARSLKRLGEPVIAVGMAGGRAGMQITDGLDAEGIVNDFVRINAESRTSTAVIDPTSGLSTEINEYGPEVTEEEIEALLDKIRYLAGAVSTIVFAGSLPRRVPTAFYAEIVREMNRRRIRTVVDVEGEPLRLALAAEPSLVFPNQREAEALVGNEFQTDEDFQHGLASIAAMGARGVLVTLTTGCYALLQEGKGKRRMYRAWIPRVEAVSAVGSGDAFLAGYVAALEAGPGPEECLRAALACGAANTQTVGAGVFDPRDVPRYSSMVEVQEIGAAAAAS